MQDKASQDREDTQPARKQVSSLPADESGPRHGWIAVREEFTPDKTDPKGCTPPFIMQIENSSAFLAGPCTIEDEPLKGKLTPEEALELDGLIEPFTKISYIPTTPECEKGKYDGPLDLAVILPPNSAFHVFEYRKPDKKICLRGPGDKAKALGTFMHDLFKKYYPKTRPRS